MIRCPSCGGTESHRKGGPRTLGDITFRRHVCDYCGRVYLSAQMVIEGDNAELLEAELDEVLYEPPTA